MITDDFNKYLADLFLESLKGLSSSSHSIMQRMNILNIESIKSQIKNGRSVILAGTHYCNWEWGVFPFGKEFGKDCLGFYKPIANKYIDNYIRNGRQKDGIQMVSIKDTRLHFSEDNHKRVYVLIADQNPSNLKEAIWCNFMGKDTACLHGVEKYARQYDMPVYYIHNAYTGRGRYQISFELITENPNALPHGAITTKYMGLLENELKAEPRYWLWSHKRWKHTREVIRS